MVAKLLRILGQVPCLHNKSEANRLQTTRPQRGLFLCEISILELRQHWCMTSSDSLQKQHSMLLMHCMVEIIYTSLFINAEIVLILALSCLRVEGTSILAKPWAVLVA